MTVQVGAALGFLVIRRAGSTRGASTFPNDLAEPAVRRRRVTYPVPVVTGRYILPAAWSDLFNEEHIILGHLSGFAGANPSYPA
jgi:hypothetical protein